MSRRDNRIAGEYSNEQARSEAEAERNHQEGRVRRDQQWRSGAELRHGGGDYLEQGVGEARAKRAAGKREHQAFRQQLADDSPACRPERAPNAQLDITLDAACEQHANDIRAADQEHDQRGTEHHGQAAGRARGHVLLHRDRPPRPQPVRVLRPRERVELSGSCAPGRSGFQSGNYCDRPLRRVGPS